MTELKADSQSIRTVQTQPSTKKRSTKPTPTPDVAATGESETAESEEAAPKRKRRATTPKTTPAQKNKRQATSKSTKQPIASTQVKLQWELSQSSIAARFAQLEHDLQHYKNGVDSILSEMDQLKELAQQFEKKEAQRASGLKLPLETHQKVPEPQKVQEPDIVEHPPVAPSRPPVPPIAQTDSFQQVNYPNRELERLRNQTGLRSRASRSRRSFDWERLFNRLLKLPNQSSGLAIDAALWILAAAGLRYALRQLISLIPMLAIPVNIAIFIPVIVAIFLALCVPKSDRVFVYRLLLIALGLFVGGRL